jgi:hypothetical protein
MKSRTKETMRSDDDVDRIYGALVEAILDTRTGSFAAPVTVAEIYQDLVPYRMVRSVLGFNMNADYEHTLLRLLAGAGELARLEPMEAAAELREELESPNPNVGLFRKFAGCDVWIAPPEDTPGGTIGSLDSMLDRFAPAAAATAPAAAAAADERPAAEPAGARPATPEPAVPAWGGEAAAEEDADDQAVHAAAPVAGDDDPDGQTDEEADDKESEDEPEYELVPVRRPRIVPSAAAALDPRRAGGAAARGASVTSIDRTAPHHCAFCDSRLPNREHLRFCPFCGNDQAQRPCGGCGEPLEPEWRYCVACGTAAAPS